MIHQAATKSLFLIAMSIAFFANAPARVVANQEKLINGDFSQGLSKWKVEEIGDAKGAPTAPKVSKGLSIVAWDGEKAKVGSGWANLKSSSILRATGDAHSGNTAMELKFKTSHIGVGAGWDGFHWKTGTDVGFRDGNWHQVVIPLAELTQQDGYDPKNSEPNPIWLHGSRRGCWKLPFRRYRI